METSDHNYIKELTGSIESKKIDVFCKSNIGLRNRTQNEKNQDAFEARIDNKVVVVAIADGLGSCKLSSVGSKEAVKILCDWVNDELVQYKEVDDDIARIIVNRVIDRWKFTFGENYYDYDTTLLFFIYYEQNVIVGGIGDGMVLLKIDDNYNNLSWSDKVFGNQTNSMSSTNAKDEFDVTIIYNIDQDSRITCILSTDGISDDIEEKNQEALIEHVIDNISTKGFKNNSNSICNWIDNWKAENSTDDKTIGIISLRRSNE